MRSSSSLCFLDLSLASSIPILIKDENLLYATRYWRLDLLYSHTSFILVINTVVELLLSMNRSTGRMDHVQACWTAPVGY